MNDVREMVLARDILSDCGVDSWLAFGTLLGLHREGGLIKGDNDIDFVVKMEQFTDKAIKKISKRMKREGYKCEIKWEKKKKIIICKKNELDIAIAGFWKNNEYRLRRSWKIPDRFFSDGTIQYKGQTFRCHSPIEEYLAYIYSNWSVPAPKSDGRKLYNEACLRKGVKKTTRTDIINYLIKRNGYKSYLEIGVYKPERNFDKIKCKLKHGVDPNGRATFTMTSGEFFMRQKELVNGRKYDIIFIDGLHKAHQVVIDALSALSLLNNGGTIVMHDCNPPTEWHQREEKGKGDWNGTIWKAYAFLRMTRPDLSMCVIDCDCGLGIIRRGCQNVYSYLPPIEASELPYSLLESDRKTLLNLISPKEFYDTGIQAKA